MYEVLDAIADDVAIACNDVPPGVAAELVAAIERIDSALSMLTRLPTLVAA